MTRRLSLLIRLLPCLVCAATVITFLPALDGQFLNWDDEENFLRNEGFRGLGLPQLRWMFSTSLMGHYIPLTWLSLGVNYVTGGLEPRGYLAGNVLLHAGAAVLAFLIARRLLAAALRDRAPGYAVELGAAFAALVFAVHPLRVESVAWITERRDGLSGVWYLLAAWAWLRAVDEGDGIRPGFYALSLGAFVAGLLSKASGVMLPFAFLVLDAYPLRRLSLGWRRLIGEKLPHIALGGLGAAAALWAVRQGTMMTSYGDYGLGARIAMTAYSFMFYPWKWVWPVGLSPMYELPARIDPLAPRFLLPLVAWVLGTAALIALRHRWPAGLAAWAYSSLMLLPVSGIVHAGFQLAHDRYSYLSGLGLALLAGGALVAVLRAGAESRLTPRLAVLLGATAAVVVLGLAAQSWRQSKIWRSSEVLWAWAVDLDPECAICHNNLGSAIIHSPSRTALSPAVAETHFRRAIALRPGRPTFYHNLGGALALQGRHADAEAPLREFLRLSPQTPEAPGRLGMIYVDQGRYAEAIPLLRRALAMEPRFTAARADLVRALRMEAETQRTNGRDADGRALETEARNIEKVAPPGSGPASGASPR
jgi:tetratricopeptide (TPR) repeat protein